MSINHTFRETLKIHDSVRGLIEERVAGTRIPMSTRCLVFGASSVYLNLLELKTVLISYIHFIILSEVDKLWYN